MKAHFILVIFLLIFIACKKEEPPTITTSEITNITGTNAVCGGTILKEGSGVVLSRGVCWSTGTTPTVEDSKTIDGAGAGTFTSNISGLKGATIYYVRSYATNEVGTGYGMTMSFKTLGNLPTATTLNVTNISPSSVILHGFVNANYLLTTVVFEYGTTTSYGLSITGTSNTLNSGDITEVTANLTNLSAGTVYHYRVIASNSVGTTKGDDMVFTTNLADACGNIYTAIVIGNQIWLKENLTTSKYLNGDNIQNVMNGTSWGTLTTGAYCIFNNSTEYSAYGKLYNWYVVADSRKICPSGWHVPTDNEWKDLEIYLGMSIPEVDLFSWRGTTQGTQMKMNQENIIPWNGSNTSGFSAIPGGYRESGDGTYNSMGNVPGGIAAFWTSSESNSVNAYMRYLSTNYTQSFRAEYFKTAGYSIRCIKD